MAGWMMVLLICAAYLFMTVLSSALFTALGRRNPETIGDSFTGDDVLDGICFLAWPATWLVLAALAAAALIEAGCTRLGGGQNSGCRELGHRRPVTKS